MEAWVCMLNKDALVSSMVLHFWAAEPRMPTGAPSSWASSNGSKLLIAPDPSLCFVINKPSIFLELNYPKTSFNTVARAFYK